MRQRPSSSQFSRVWGRGFRAKRHSRGFHVWVVAAAAVLCVTAAVNVSLVAALRASPPPSGSVTELAVVVPFTSQHSLGHLYDLLGDWHAAGPPCSQAKNLPVNLVFYHNKSPAHLDAATFLRNVSATPLLTTFRHCFHTIDLIHAHLEGSDDEYPAGPSNMFFALFLHPRFVDFRRNHAHMFWMESDVRVVKPAWVNGLLSHLSGDPFWVKGSMTQGAHLDSTVMFSANQDWVAHINGNALYNLQDPEFVQFLQLVVQYEPPNHYWKPFDISMWRVLHAFPYTWHLYQRYRHKFQHCDFMKHYSGTMAPEVKATARDSAGTLFVHGGGTYGLTKYNEKFAAGNDLSRIQWDDPVTEDLGISVMLRSHAPDFPFARVAVRSVRKYLPGAVQIVVVIPPPDEATFAELLAVPTLSLVLEQDIFNNGRLQQKYSKLMADTYCSGAFIFHLDSDVVLFRRVLRRDLFWQGKPILSFDRYANLPEMVRVWQAGTSEAVGEEVAHEFSRTNAHLYPRHAYQNARAHLETRFNSSLVEFLRTRAATLYDLREANASAAGDIGGLRTMFSDFNFLGAFLWFHARDSVAWMPLDTLDQEGMKFPPPLLPPLVCQGNAQLASYVARWTNTEPTFKKKIAGLTRQEAALESAVATGSCGPVDQAVAALEVVMAQVEAGSLPVEL